MSGAGSQHQESYDKLQKALEEHAKAASGAESYALVDWVVIGFVMNLEQEGDSEGGEYIMASSSKAPHIVEGLLAQIHLFQTAGDDDDD